eukprot:CAMPEP_0172152300 /NCGR_PEP_ID=MMETSP1050-20130122/757_1 /TAXON_ID=233186 /ORGANISM="Cryptomonas curvata, Strain CCAP979/52" /LENGTH=374 /DNA_ID=CAMNT_0012820599 /DNA_START=1213 /DNA_END=2334 /DNA_ORIENTATION=-
MVHSAYGRRTDKKLNIITGYQASIVPGSVIAVLFKADLRSLNGVSPPSNSSVVLSGPKKTLLAISVQGATTVDQCSGLELRAIVLSPRPLVFTWRCLNDAEFDSFLVTVSGSALILAAGAPEMGVVDKTFEIAVSATDFMGSTSSKIVLKVHKQSWPTPQIQFSPPSLSTTREKPILVRGQAIFSSCPVDQDDLEFSWRFISGPVDFPVSALSSKIPQIYIPPNTLSAGSTYILGLQVSMRSDLSQMSEGTFFLHIGRRKLVATMDCGSSIRISTNSVLALSALGSVDPDQLTMISDDPPLAYTWTCLTSEGVLTVPCRDQTGSPLSLPREGSFSLDSSTLLPADAPYIFQATIRKRWMSPATAAVSVFVLSPA